MRNLLLTIAILALATAAFAGSGQDTSGEYFWADHDESYGPTYSWYDATGGTDTGLNADDGYVNLAAPFDVMFYDATFATGSNISVNSNGALCMNPNTYVTYVNIDLPNGSAPHNLIAGYWDDLMCYTSNGAYVYSDTTTIGGENVWVISYNGLDHFGYSGNNLYWQFKIWETDGANNSTIEIHYQDTSPEMGYAATSGIENSDSSEGHAYCCDTAGGLMDSDVVRYADTDNILTGFDLLTPADGTVIPVWD
jgi:hypothetical protein